MSIYDLHLNRDSSEGLHQHSRLSILLGSLPLLLDTTDLAFPGKCSSGRRENRLPGHARISVQGNEVIANKDAVDSADTQQLIHNLGAGALLFPGECSRHAKRFAQVQLYAVGVRRRLYRLEFHHDNSTALLRPLVSRKN